MSCCEYEMKSSVIFVTEAIKALLRVAFQRDSSSKLLSLKCHFCHRKYHQREEHLQRFNMTNVQQLIYRKYHQPHSNILILRRAKT